MDRLILDFEENKLIIETDHQTGTEIYAGLKEKKAEIYKLLGYKETNVVPFVKVIEDLLNGHSTEEEAVQKIDSWLKE